MIMDGCQGKPRTPTIREKTCPVCGNTIEIFSTDTQVACDKCGFVAYNDALSCVQWCQYARKCVGDEMYERMMEIARRQKAERSTKEEREMTVAEQKAALRKKLRTMERILPQSYRDESAAAICRRVTELPEYQAAKVVFAFVGTEREIDTTALLRDVLDSGKTLVDLKGKEFYGEYLAKTDPLGADVPNPVSHVAYGYATQMCILDKETGRIKKMVAAHDVGKAVNPLSIEGQIEGGVVMSMGYALTEKYPIDENCKPTAKYGMLGLFRANQIPQEIEAIVVEKPGLNVAGGAIGIGEITSIPTAPAIADAYFRFDGERRTKLPLANTPYERKG